MTQKADLREAMLKKAQPRARTISTTRLDEARHSPAPTAPAAGTSAPYVQPSRVGKKAVTGFFPPGVRKQLKLMTVEQETTIQDLMAEAFNDLFAKYGKPEIAPTSDSL